MFTKTNLSWKGIWVICLSLLVISCGEIDESIAPNLEINLKSIPEVLKTMDKETASGNENARKSAGNTYATFNAALGKSGLASVFAQNELTVFAPNDAAFAALGLNPGNVGDVEGLTEILLYHVVEGSVFAADLTEGLVPTVNGAAVQISLDGGPMVNEANIILTDKEARNGVIHGINAVLFPPVSNIMELLDAAAADGDFTVLQAAIDAIPGLRDEIASSSNITVFAPSNVAFNTLGLFEETVGNLNPTFLENVLRYHVFDAGRVFSNGLMDGDITMSQGGTVTVDTSGPSLKDENGGISNITQPDIQASNGVIHAVDAVLIPL